MTGVTLSVLSSTATRCPLTVYVASPNSVGVAVGRLVVLAIGLRLSHVLTLPRHSVLDSYCRTLSGPSDPLQQTNSLLGEVS